MQLETYVQVGDAIKVVYRSLSLEGFSGRVLQIRNGELGYREFIIQRDGTELLHEGTIGVREDAAMLSVQRGDSWVHYFAPLTLEKAQEKALRNVASQTKRIQQKVPLFADQIEATPIDPEAWVARDRESLLEQLEREHALAIEATCLRDEVRQLVTPEEFATLCDRRMHYPSDGTYGTIFWRTQLEVITTNGQPDNPVPLPPPREKIQLPWLALNSNVNWATAPGGPRLARVLFIGSDKVCVRVQGEPLRDYNPKLIPNPVVWIKPEELAESTEDTPILPVPA